MRFAQFACASAAIAATAWLGVAPSSVRARDAASMPASAASTPTLARVPAQVPATPPAADAPRQVLVMLRSPPAHARVDGSYGGAGYGDAARAQALVRVGARIAAAHGFTVVTQWPMRTLGMDCVVLQLPPGAPVDASIAALQAHPEVAWAQTMNQFQAQGRADAPRPHADPLYALQPAATQWHLDELHAVATGRHVTVAVVDSGVDAAHPDLGDAVTLHANFVPDRPDAAELHGTAVAGLVAARADNGLGIVGIAPDAHLLALRACWQVSVQQTLCNSLSLAKALSFAIEHHADVINMSLSGPDDLLLGRLIDVALSRREQVVAAVDAHAAGGGFPATHPGVIAVSDPLADSPNASAWTAPARDLPTTVPGGAWRMVTGTSFAAGEVSGLLALLAQARADGASHAMPANATSLSDAAPAHLVRLPGGAIDACASLRDAVAATAADATSPSSRRALPDCHALLAADR